MYRIINAPQLGWEFTGNWETIPDFRNLEKFPPKAERAMQAINNMKIVVSGQTTTVPTRTKIQNNVVVDTLVVYDNTELETAQSLSAYQRTQYYEPVLKRFNEIRNLNLANLNKYQTQYEANLLLAEQQRITDSLESIEHQRRMAEQEAVRQRAIAEEQDRRMMGDWKFEFTEPAGPIQTKSFTNVKGAKVTYEYYVGDNGYEVMHGRFIETMTFNDHRYWLGLNSVGWVYLDGTETLTCHYQNGVLHGQMTYRSNVDYDATFDNARSLNQTYNFDIYKGFLDGSFDFWFKDIHYVGQAFKGIIQGSCKYETREGYHGSIDSKPFSTEKGTSVQIAIPTVDTGWHDIEMSFSIDLPSILCNIPAFRFPFINVKE
jgi:hypothetical protein